MAKATPELMLSRLERGETDLGTLGRDGSAKTPAEAVARMVERFGKQKTRCAILVAEAMKVHADRMGDPGRLSSLIDEYEARGQAAQKVVALLRAKLREVPRMEV